jgi:hypothetical protein
VSLFSYWDYYESSGKERMRVWHEYDSNTYVSIIMLINDIHNEQFNTIQVVVYVIIDVCAGA